MSVETMGPVEFELRSVGVRWWQIQSRAAFEVWCDAVESLGLGDLWTYEGVSADVSSEAIEAAEALSL